MCLWAAIILIQRRMSAAASLWHDICKAMSIHSHRACISFGIETIPSSSRPKCCNKCLFEQFRWTSLRHETSRLLFDYWNAIRNGRAAPERSEIEPGELRQILGDTFILEVSRQMRTIAFRLAGTRLCAAHGRELKGLGFLALWREEDNYRVAKAVHRVYTQYDPVVMTYTAKSESGRFADYECILLPLLPAADGDARILGAASTRHPPYWIGADPLEMNHLRSIRAIESKSRVPALTGPEPNSSIRRLTSPRRKGHLTVFDGGLSSGDQN